MLEQWKSELKNVHSGTELKALKKKYIGKENEQLTVYTPKFKHHFFNIDMQSAETFSINENMMCQFEPSHCSTNLVFLLLPSDRGAAPERHQLPHVLLQVKHVQARSTRSENCCLSQSSGACRFANE